MLPASGDCHIPAMILSLTLVYTVGEAADLVKDVTSSLPGMDEASSFAEVMQCVPCVLPCLGLVNSAPVRFDLAVSQA